MGLIQFPPNPSPGDIYTVPGGPKYQWDGGKWVCIGGGGGGGGGGGLGVVVGPDPPDNPQDGQLWWSTTQNRLNVFVGGVWQPAVTVPPPVTPAGPNQAVQFNNNGVFGGTGNVTLDPAGQILLGPVAVASLPAASPLLAGARATVSDALSSTGIVQGGGANTIPVFCDGTDWRAVVTGDAVLLDANNVMTPIGVIGWGPGRPSINWSSVIIPGSIGATVDQGSYFYGRIEFTGGTAASVVIFSTPEVNFTNLSTIDPGVAGRVWNNGGVMTISAG